MNEEQHDHLDRIQSMFKKDHAKKFILGAKEHRSELQNDFSATQLLDFTIEEILDLVSYAYTLREKLAESLDTREEQNGLPYCKNCGLGE